MPSIFSLKGFKYINTTSNHRERASLRHPLPSTYVHVQCTPYMHVFLSMRTFSNSTNVGTHIYQTHPEMQRRYMYLYVTYHLSIAATTTQITCSSLSVTQSFIQDKEI